MNNVEIKKQAKAFAEYWKDKGYEKGESQKFWLSLLRDILGIEHPEKYISFEDQVKLDHTSFIDGFISETHVLIEQKGRDKDLRKAIKQSDGTLLTPFQQAKRYSAELPYDDRPRWIITCNFQEFLIYDMNKPNSEPESVLLKNLQNEYSRLKFIVNSQNENIKKEMEISVKAGEIVGVLYDALLKQYNEKDEEELKSLNELCVRLVFCLYAEDSGLFGEKLAFHDYLKGFQLKDTRRALIDLFRVLDTKVENRDKYLDEELAKFPYVNGGLFANENIIIPHLTQEIVDVLLQKASENFDWSEISPTIFGAVFESTLNPETRRSGGMHYTSIENIHKVIDPLFLDDLKEEFEQIKKEQVIRTKKLKLSNYRNKLASLTFLDPACGSGNFLTETYISLRKLENEALSLEINSDKKVEQNQIAMGFDDTIKVSISQFYGIEINDFAVTVAKTALWISESQMMKETEMIINRPLEFFPLKSYANIVEGNALRIDWNEVVSKEKISYIMGNPPFVGYKEKSTTQKEDMDIACFNTKRNEIIKNVKSLDFVSGWYYKCANYLSDTKNTIKVAFVSTNSITQGEQVCWLWKPLIEDYSLKINFAYQTFKWNSESSTSAAVHCVIIGFSFNNEDNKKILFTENNKGKIVSKINPYLVESDNIYIESRRNSLCDCKKITLGVHLFDNHNFIFETDEDKNNFLKTEPKANTLFKKWVSGSDIINNRNRWYLDLTTLSPKEINEMPNCKKLIKNVIEYRKISGYGVDYPLKPKQGWKADSCYLAIPFCSSENRRYIPMTFFDKNTVITMPDLAIPNASLYDFGILTSNVHMSWMRVVCGRLKSDYRYATGIVYNNFPWPNPTKKQAENIEKTAQMILNARNLYPDSTLADLYDEASMPFELRKAHQLNDRAVMEAYGFYGKIKTESECVAELMKMYQKLTKES